MAFSLKSLPNFAFGAIRLAPPSQASGGTPAVMVRPGSGKEPLTNISAMPLGGVAAGADATVLQEAGNASMHLSI
jgi:hypothetical protein